MSKTIIKEIKIFNEAINTFLIKLLIVISHNRFRNPPGATVITF